MDNQRAVSRERFDIAGTKDVDQAEFEHRSGTSTEDFELIRRLPMFQGIAPEQVRHVLGQAQIRRFARDRMLFMQDDPASAFYVVFEGWVKLFRQSAAGQESVIALIGPGESFAEAALFESGLYPVSAAVVEDARLLWVPAPPFLRALREDSELCLNMMAAMSRWLRRFVQEVEQLTARTTAERLAGFLLKRCPRTAGVVTIRLPTDKSLIAGRLGMQPETLSRSLAKLRSLGVETHGNEVIVHDVSALYALYDGR